MRRGVAGAATLLIAAATLTAVPLAASATDSTAASAADDAQVVQDGDSVTYADPSLARERTTTVEGTLRITSVDRVDGGDYLYAIEQPDGDSVPVELSEDLPVSAANGAIEAEVVDPGSSSPQLAEATVKAPVAEAADANGRAHRAYVVRVTGMSASAPSADSVAARLQSAALDEWQVESGGAIGAFSVAAVDVKDLSLASTGQSATTACRMSNYSGLWSKAAALFPGVSFDSSDADAGTANHLVVLVAGCSPASNPLGIGTVGDSIDSGGMTVVLWDTGYVDQTAVHELGHNFSLGHANVGGEEYYDLYSVMGFGTDGGRPQALDSLFRDRLGITASDEITTVPASSDRTIELAARGLDSGVRGIEVTDPDDDTTYWVDYRTAAGRDSGSTFAGGVVMSGGGLAYAPGVVIYRRADDYESSGDIDVVEREAGAVDDTSWSAGQTWTSPSGALQLQVVATTQDAASVRVVASDGPLAATSPTISGTARVGETLTAEPGGYTPAATSLRYQWYADSSAVAGATSSTFTISSAYVGDRLAVAVTGVREGYTPTTRTSTSTAPVAAGVLTATAPTISGVERVGGTLRVTVGTFSPTPSTYHYQWYAGSTAISGATKSSYTVSAARRGDRLRVRVTGLRSGYDDLRTYSAYTAAMLPSGTFSSTAPRISGTLRVGMTVRAVPGSYSPAPTSYRYQWYEGSKAISGATSSTYTISSYRRGDGLKVRVKALREGWTTSSRTSKLSAKVGSGVFTTVAAPTVSGEATAGSTLRAKVGSFSPKPSSYRYQWYAGSRAIKGATKSTYKVASVHRGHSIRVRVKAARTGYTSKYTYSQRTALVTR